MSAINSMNETINRGGNVRAKFGIGIIFQSMTRAN